MMSVVFKRPYEFVPPHRGNLWPSFIQRFRLVDRYLRKKEGVVGYECRHLDRFQASLERGDGVLLAPNHCRYADPLVLGWPAREARAHLYAMASWHLFNEGWFDSFAIQKMGAFSVNREAADLQSIKTAVEILATAERPLILFPEGTTNRTNDVLKPMLEGVTFIARDAARRRKKKVNGQVVVHPVALKYLCEIEINDWADEQLGKLESRLGWRYPAGRTILQRTIRLAEGLLALKEIEYVGRSQSGDLQSRRDALIAHLLEQVENRNQMTSSNGDVRTRVRAIRSEAVKHFFSTAESLDPVQLKNDVLAADLAQELLSYPDCYLQSDEVTDTRIVETIQRMQESLEGKADVSIPLRVVIEFDEAIVVPAEKSKRGQPDPLLDQIRQRLESMLERLSHEARPLDD